MDAAGAVLLNPAGAQSNSSLALGASVSLLAETARAFNVPASLPILEPLVALGSSELPSIVFHFVRRRGFNIRDSVLCSASLITLAYWWFVRTRRA